MEQTKEMTETEEDRILIYEGSEMSAYYGKMVDDKPFFTIEMSGLDSPAMMINGGFDRQDVEQLAALAENGFLDKFQAMIEN